MPSILIPGRAARGQRPPYGRPLLNRDSRQFDGLRRLWLFGTVNPSEYTLGLPVTLSGPPVMTAIDLGGMAGYCTGGNSYAYTQGEGVSASNWSVHLRFKALAWPGAFTTLFDTANRHLSLFIETAGNVSFQSASLGGLDSVATGFAVNVWNTLTAVIDGTRTYGYVNGRQISSVAVRGDLGLSDDLVFGGNPSGGGSMPDIVYEHARLYDRSLSPNEVWTLDDPATRWDLYWVPGRRVYFDTGATSQRRFYLV